VLGNGVIGASSEIMAVYPNSWDVPMVTKVDPFALKENVVSTSPYCLLHPEGSPCNEFTIPANKAPVARAGKDLEVSAGKDLKLDGSASYDEDGKIIYYKWGKISGSNNVKIMSPSSPMTTLRGLTPGTYVFSLKVTDNGWAVDSAQVRIRVK
jgi:hypothetical protein